MRGRGEGWAGGSGCEAGERHRRSFTSGAASSGWRKRCLAAHPPVAVAWLVALLRVSRPMRQPRVRFLLHVSLSLRSFAGSAHSACTRPRRRRLSFRLQLRPRLSRMSLPSALDAGVTHVRAGRRPQDHQLLRRWRMVGVMRHTEDSAWDDVATGNSQDTF